MASNFDDISKGLASRASRRGALRLFGAAVVGAVAATFRPGGASADGNLALKCNKACKRYSGQQRATCVRSCVCEGLGGEICGPSKICCPKGTRCGVVTINGKPIEDLVI